MLKKLQRRWKVNGVNLVLIIATFAIGGSLCGWAGRKLLLWTNMERGFTWFFLYIFLITLLWPICVLLVSYPLGQFAFFKKYIARVWNKMTGKKGGNSKNIVVFASGAGSNAKKIIDHFQQPGKKGSAGVVLIVCNNPHAGVIGIARENNIPVLMITKERFFDGDAFLPELIKYAPDLLVLAGFLWKIPVKLIKAYPGKILNIHPALLPKYGGKGMYGNKVHEAVIANKETESGISIHFVDEWYDHGEVIFREKCRVNDNETPESLAQKIHLLEHKYYPSVIESVLQMQNPG